MHLCIFPVHQVQTTYFLTQLSPTPLTFPNNSWKQQKLLWSAWWTDSWKCFSSSCDHPPHSSDQRLSQADWCSSAAVPPPTSVPEPGLQTDLRPALVRCQINLAIRYPWRCGMNQQDFQKKSLIRCWRCQPNSHLPWCAWWCVWAQGHLLSHC